MASRAVSTRIGTSSSCSRSALGDLEPVQVRQPEIEDHQIGQEARAPARAPRAVVGDPDLVALHAQRALEHLGDRVVVLDHQDAGWTLEIGHVQRRW